MRLRATIAMTAIGAVSFSACTGGGGDDFCSTLLSLENSDVDPDDDPEEARELVREAADAAPDEIEAEFERFADLFEQLLDDPESVDPSAAEGLEADFEAMGEYVGENCDGLDADVFGF